MLQETYQTKIIPKLKEELKKDNALAVPRLLKIVVNVGMKEALENPKSLETVTTDLMSITGQKPVITKAKKAIATYKLRAGDKIGLKVTLRGTKMYDFLEKIIAIVFPRVRDFRGLSLSAFDENGNYSLGISEYLVFPEIDSGKIDKIRGLEVTICTSAKNKVEAKALLTHLGLPFEKQK